MRRLTTALIAACVLTLAPASPAGSQIPDVPPLGFTIDPTEGAVGSEVSGTVDTTAVAENCITDPTEFVAQFVDPEDPFGGSAPYFDALLAYVDEVHGGDLGELDIVNDPEAFAIVVAAFFPLGLAIDLGEEGALVEAAMDQTFIMAFADIATASPIDPLGSFDRESGAGSVEVPELVPGGHPVIATCVGIPEGLAVADITAAVEAGRAFVEANLEAPFPDDVLGPEFAEVAAQVAPSILRSLVEPRALGVQFFCIHDASGTCPGGGPGPGPDPGPGPGPGTPPTAPPATPVPGDPDFTG